MKITIHNPFSPIVYTHWSGERCFYVGKSRLGLPRPFEKSHKMYAHRNEITHTDINFVESDEAAILLERELTERLKPIYDESYLAGFTKHGKDKHKNRLRSIPPWASNDVEISKILKLAFPKMDVDVSQRRAALRWSEVICKYWRLGLTRYQVAHQMNISHRQVHDILARAKRVNGGKLASGRTRSERPTGRPKKITSPIAAPSDTTTL